MNQFKQFGITSLIGITLFTGIYSSIQLMDWLFFPWLQIAILSTLTFAIAVIQYLHRDKLQQSYIYVTWGFVVFEWLICLLLFNQVDLIGEYIQFIFLPLLYFIYYSLQQLSTTRSARVQKQIRIVFYLLIPSTLTFLILPTQFSAGGLEVLFLYFLGLIVFSKAEEKAK